MVGGVVGLPIIQPELEECKLEAAQAEFGNVFNRSKRGEMGAVKTERAKPFWRSLARWLKISGSTCFAGAFLAHFALLCYLSCSRPLYPQPERGWITGITWTHPLRYGTQLDEAYSQWLFEMGFPSFGLILAGIAINIYILNDYSDIRTKPNPR